ncbi:MAG TPA: hypothetical protein VFB22_01870 [Candidatus Baltobacteraceae bacterium]|nr:hypothetical protein [Candidatus Baltobacteraceae bacterium]
MTALGALTFERWARMVVDVVRMRLPDLVASRCDKTVTLRYGSRTITLEDAGATFWVFVEEGGNRRTFLAGEDHTERTARIAAKPIAGSFDPRFARPDA